MPENATEAAAADLSLNQTGAAEEINRLAELVGSHRRVRPDTLRDWRLDKKGPPYRKVSRWFVEYDAETLRRWTLEVYLGLPERKIRAAEAAGLLRAIAV